MDTYIRYYHWNKHCCDCIEHSVNYKIRERRLIMSIKNEYEVQLGVVYSLVCHKKDEVIICLCSRNADAKHIALLLNTYGGSGHDISTNTKTVSRIKTEHPTKHRSFRNDVSR